MPKCVKWNKQSFSIIWAAAPAEWKAFCFQTVALLTASFCPLPLTLLALDVSSQDKSGLFSAVFCTACLRSKSTRTQSRLWFCMVLRWRQSRPAGRHHPHLPAWQGCVPSTPGLLAGSYLSYFTFGSWCLLVPYLLPLVTTSLFWKSVSLFLFCYIHPFVLFFRFHTR